MNECCEWWSAIKALRRAEPVRDDWALAADRCKRAHEKRCAKPPNGRNRNVESWYEASRRILSSHLTKLQHAKDAWAPAILKAISNRHKSTFKRQAAINPCVCQKCRSVPKWVSRCLETHSQRICSAKRTDWQRKAEAIACGLRNRTKGNSRNVLPKASNWTDGITRAVLAFNAKRSRANASEWDKWSVNVASNNRKRQRGKQHRKAKRQSDQQSNTSAG